MKFISNIKYHFNVKKVIKKLNNNEIVIMPTDTIYGIMGKASPENMKKINELKQSNISKKISVIFMDRKSADEYIKASPYQKSILDAEFPGNKTFIVTASPKAKDLIGPSENIGLRIPSKNENKFLFRIISKTGPLLATSVNVSGDEPINDYKEIKEHFEDKVSFIVKYKFDSPVPSTIVDISNSKVNIVRHGK